MQVTAVATAARPAAPWTRWPGWADWVGCQVCAELDAEAPCWGRAGCHGYENGCGCRQCAARRAGAAEAAE